MPKTLRNTHALRRVALCAGLMIASVFSAAAQRGDSVRMYVLDGGTLTIGDPTVFGLTREDVPDLTTMPVPATRRAPKWRAAVGHRAWRSTHRPVVE